jgi:tRNA/rRNA methyltransferase
VHAALAQGRVALLFGSEKHGLSREDLEHCHWLVRIATEEAQPSMNLGQAAAVCLWELAREAAPRLENAGEAGAASGELERLGALVMELLNTGGYLHPETTPGTEAEVRRMLRRLHVTDADTHLLMGMVRKLLWKLRADGQRGPKDAG